MVPLDKGSIPFKGPYSRETFLLVYMVFLLHWIKLGTSLRYDSAPIVFQLIYDRAHTDATGAGLNDEGFF